MIFWRTPFPINVFGTCISKNWGSINYKATSTLDFHIFESREFAVPLYICINTLRRIENSSNWEREGARIKTCVFFPSACVLLRHPIPCEFKFTKKTVYISGLVTQAIWCVEICMCTYAHIEYPEIHIWTYANITCPA